MPKRGRSRKKSRTQNVAAEEATSALTGASDRKVPKSLIVRKGKTATEVAELVADMRRLMLPFTAIHFKEDPTNRKLTLQQYCSSLALPLGITHILQFSQKDDRCNLRLARIPEGPVLSFRVHQFSLSSHIVRLQKRPMGWTESMNTHPSVVVTNNFGDHTAAPHVKLMRITFQNLFPQINVSSVKLKECRRIVLFNLVDEEETASTTIHTGETGTTTKRQIVQVRHYAVKATPVGVNRRVRRIIQTNKPLPNLHKCDDIADYLTGQVAATMSDAPSDSEPEEDQVVQLSDQYVGRGNNKNQKSALKLVELGPRLSLELLKVEKGLDSANSPCLYNAHVTKTSEEAARQQAEKQKLQKLKEERKKIQEQNVERKRQVLEEKRAAKRQRLQERRTEPQLLKGQEIEGVSDSDDEETNEE